MIDRAELQAALGLESSDVDLNREGKLSPRQADEIRAFAKWRRTTVFLALGAAGALALFGGIAAHAPLAEVIGGAVGGILFATLLVILLDNLLFRPLSRQAEGGVRTVEGTIERRYVAYSGRGDAVWINGMRYGGDEDRGGAPSPQRRSGSALRHVWRPRRRGRAHLTRCRRSAPGRCLAEATDYRMIDSSRATSAWVPMTSIRTHLTVLLGASLASVACGELIEPAATSSSSSEDATTCACEPMDSGGPSESTTSSTSSESGDSTGAPPQGCGDGVVEDDEQCDDGNADPDDACSNECVPHCGKLWELELPSGWNPKLRALDDGTLLVAVWAAATDGFSPADTGTPAIAHIDAEGRVISSSSSDVTMRGFAHVVADDAGNLFVMGALALPGELEAHARLMKLAAPELEVAWDVALDPSIDQEPAWDLEPDLAITQDGDVVLSVHFAKGELDTDVRLVRLASEDGSVLWSSDRQGATTKTESLDFAGPIAVADGNALFSTSRVQIGPEAWEVQLLRTDALDGSIAHVTTPPVAEADVHYGRPASAGSRVALTITRLADQTNHHVDTFVYDGGELVWSATPDVPEVGEMWGNPVVDDAGNVTIVGETITPDVTLERLVVRYDADGEQQCLATLAAPGGEQRRPWSVAGLADGGVVAAGHALYEDDVATWVARFRG